MKNLQLTSINLLLAVACLSAKAQKLPGIQTVNVWAPFDVNTDGKTKEWGNQFEAYNTSTSIYYTIANDSQKLYLTIQARQPAVITQIINGGVTFTIKSADKNIAPLSVTYPLISTKNDRAVVLTKLKAEPAIADTDLSAINKQLEIGCKQIRVTGIRQLKDSLISVNNTDGIKTAGLFDQQKAYTYELAISLKYLVPLIDDLGTFSYKVELRGLSNGIVSGPDATVPTFFSGRYTLARQ